MTSQNRASPNSREEQLLVVISTVRKTLHHLAVAGTGAVTGRSKPSLLFQCCCLPLAGGFVDVDCRPWHRRGRGYWFRDLPFLFQKMKK